MEFKANYFIKALGNGDRLTSIEAVSYFLFFSSFFSFLFLAFALITKIGNVSYVFPIALICSALLIKWVFSLRDAICAVGCGAVIITISILLSMLLSDYSYDGNYYHQEATALLAQGWNPYHLSELLKCDNTWIRHYGIGLEMMYSTIVSLTGSVEAGKSFNLILAISALGLVFTFLYKLNKNIKKRLTFIASVAIIGCPVVICQIFTYYIDWAKYIYDIFILISIYGICINRSKVNILSYIAVIILAVATKFNIWFEICLIIALATIWLICKHRKQVALKLSGYGIMGVLLGLMICYHPYYHNYLLGGHIFYPLMGENAMDIMTGNTPDVFGHGRALDFILSLSSLSYPSVDMRVGGFGPLMLIIIIISFLIIFKLRKSIKRVWIYISICTFLSCFIFEQSWWARYICQLWLLPSIALTVAIPKASVRKLRNILISLMCVTIVMSVAYVGYTSIRMSCYRHLLYKYAQEDSSIMIVGATPQSILHLKNQGITPVVISHSDIPESYEMVKFYYNTTTQEPIILIKKTKYIELIKRLQDFPLLKFENYDVDINSYSRNS